MATIKSGSSKTTYGGVTQQPRSFLDVLQGKSTVKYNRATGPTQKTVNKAFKSYGPTSNGKGVGM